MGECAQTHSTRMKEKDKEVAAARTGGKEAGKVERRVTVAEDEGNRISFPFAKRKRPGESRETRIRQIEVYPSKCARMGRWRGSARNARRLC